MKKKKNYSLDIVQQPVRARMCGFGDKVSQGNWGSKVSAWETRGLENAVKTAIADILVGLQDRRPITPPPCIRLVVKDASTHKEMDIKSVSPHSAAMSSFVPCFAIIAGLG